MQLEPAEYEYAENEEDRCGHTNIWKGPKFWQAQGPLSDGGPWVTHVYVCVQKKDHYPRTPHSLNTSVYWDDEGQVWAVVA